VRERLSPWVSRLWEARAPKYSRALLETLALIAYQQPVTRGDIEQVRGVSVSSNIIKTLLDRDWIRIVGHRDVPGKPALYGTTKGFLDYFNLRSLDKLPPLAELRDLNKINEELGFEGDVPPSADLEDGEERVPEVVPLRAVLGQFDDEEEGGGAEVVDEALAEEERAAATEPADEGVEGSSDSDSSDASLLEKDERDAPDEDDRVEDRGGAE
jgi:segregation and condensation protein B